MHFVVGSKNCRFAIFCFSFASSSRFRAGHHRHPAPLLVLLIIPCSFTTCVVPIFTAVNERIKLMIAHFLLKRKLPVKENFALHRCACVCVRERDRERERERQRECVCCMCTIQFFVLLLQCVRVSYFKSKFKIKLLQERQQQFSSIRVERFFISLLF